MAHDPATAQLPAFSPDLRHVRSRRPCDDSLDAGEPLVFRPAVSAALERVRLPRRSPQLRAAVPRTCTGGLLCKGAQTRLYGRGIDLLVLHASAAAVAGSPLCAPSATDHMEIGAP